MADKQLKGREKKIEDKSNKDKIRKKKKNRETLISRKEEKDKKANTRCRR
jgi:hypothetical protein